MNDSEIMKIFGEAYTKGYMDGRREILALIKTIPKVTPEYLGLKTKEAWFNLSMDIKLELEILKNSSKYEVLKPEQKPEVKDQIECPKEIMANIGIDASWADAQCEFKKEYLLSIFKKYDWDKTKTAIALKVQETYLDKLIRNLNIKDIRVKAKKDMFNETKERILKKL